MSLLIGWDWACNHDVANGRGQGLEVKAVSPPAVPNPGSVDLCAPAALPRRAPRPLALPLPLPREQQGCKSIITSVWAQDGRINMGTVRA